MKARISIQPVPPDIASEAMRLEARVPGGEWQSIPLVRADSMSAQPHANHGAEAWAALGADGPLEVRGTFPDPVEQVAIRPSRREPVEARIEGNAVTAMIDHPRYLVFEINHENPDGSQSAQAHYTLYLLIDAIDDAAPHGEDPAVTVFKPGRHHPGAFAGAGRTLLLLPGVHEVDGQLLRLDSGTTLYLSGGAHLRSYVHAIDVENVAIRGPGVIDGTGVECRTREWRDDGDAAFVLIRNGRSITIDGPVIYDSPFWNLVLHGGKNITIRHYKSVCWKVNNDGVQPRNTENLLVEDCFLKCADDCVAIKSRRTAKMAHGNQTYRRLVCWNDIPGNAVEIGHTSQADELSNVRFEDIDVVHCECDNHQKFVISIFLVDHCSVRDVRYSGFNVEGSLTAGEFGFQIAESRYSTDLDRGRIEDVLVTGYRQAAPSRRSKIAGFDARHRIERVTFDNLQFEDQWLTDLVPLNLTSQHSDGIALNPLA